MNPYESPRSPAAIPVPGADPSTQDDRAHPLYVVAVLALSFIAVILIAFAIIYDLEIQADKEELEKAMRVINQK